MRVLLFLLLSLFMLPAFSADNLLRWHDAQHFTVQASMPLKAKRAWKLCALYPSLKDSYWLSLNYGMHSLDVKKARIFSPFGEKTASSALRLNPRGLFCAKRTTIFCRRWDFAHGRRKLGVCAAFIHLVKKKPRSGAESRPFVD